MEDRVKNAFDIESSFRTLEIVNSWITAADNKSSILLAFVGLIVGLSVNMYGQFSSVIVNGTVVQIMIAIIFALVYLIVLGLTVMNLALVFVARTKNKDLFSKNLVSFVSVEKMDTDEYITRAKNVSEKVLCEMILSQISINSKISIMKMKYFNKALRFGLLLIPITIILIITISFGN